jgi:L-lysine exporter family protein LysE/ArgO
VGTALSSSTTLLKLTAFGGGAFLVWYAVRSFSHALNPEALQVNEAGSTTALRTVLGQLSAFTFLNPHVYVDTVLLIGSVGAQQPPTQRMWFSAGAISASALWFLGLGFGARLLQPLFARQAAWQILDGVIGLVMLLLAYLLLRQLM